MERDIAGVGDGDRVIQLVADCRVCCLGDSLVDRHCRSLNCGDGDVVFIGIEFAVVGLRDVLD